MKKELYTEIEINAAPEKVWRILTDFEAYPNWNPFIKKIKGNLAVGEKLEVFIQPSGAKGMTFKPTLLTVEKEKELRWLGKLFVSGLFDGEHFFKIIGAADQFFIPFGGIIRSFIILIDACQVRLHIGTIGSIYVHMRIHFGVHAFLHQRGMKMPGIERNETH